MAELIRYYKGHSVKNGRQMFFKLYEKPQKELLDDEEYIVEAAAIEETGLKHYKTFAECEAENYVQREITEAEYDCYVLIQHLITEMFMHDFTGGFPRGREVLSIIRKLPRAVLTWLSEVGF